MKSDKKLVGAGLITALAASLCCITPVLVLIAGSSGVASAFSWIDPFRPYLIVITVLVLGLAWFQKLKPKKEIDCECDTDENPKFIQTNSFLGFVTVFVIVMLAFPSYSGIFYNNSVQKIIVVNKSDMRTIEFKIRGMTCSSCEEHVNHEINKLNGIIESNASYPNGNAIIEFDITKTSEIEIEKVINSTGYKVTH